MAFVKKEDLQTLIRNGILDEIIEWDDNLFDLAEVEAVSVVAGYLNARYDTEAIFAATGTDRHSTVLMLTKEVLIYSLHNRLHPRKIPKHRIRQYENAVDMLEKIQALKINPVGLPEVSEGVKDYVQFGSNKKRENHIPE